MLEDIKFDLLVRATLATDGGSGLSNDTIRYNDLKSFVLNKQINIKKMKKNFKELKNAFTRKFSGRVPKV
jgi:hypothetical protein